MPVAELVGAEPERAAEDLVAEADAEDRHVRAEQLAHRLDGGVGRSRVARAVGQEHGVSTGRLDPLGRGRRGQHVRRDAPLGHPVRRHRLDAVVERGDGEPVLADGVDPVGLRRGDLGRQVGAAHLRRVDHLAQQGFAVEIGRRHDAPHRAPLAQVPGERPGVDAADADDALGLELVVQRALRAPVGRPAGRIAHDVAGHPDAARLVVLVVDAGVADVRGGLHDDLAVVGRIGQRLLIAGHRGREDRLAERLAPRAVRLAGERAPVLEDEQSLTHEPPSLSR